MKSIRIISFTLLCLFVSGVASAQKCVRQPYPEVLSYHRPATKWLEALPIGNSHLGAMVYGGTDVEEIQLNEETFWSGSPHNNDSREAKSYLSAVRDSIFAGHEEAAAAIIDKHFIPGPHGMKYLTLGSVFLDFDDKTPATSYLRQLNLNRATASTSYKKGDVVINRSVFASMADNAIIVRMVADKKKAISFRMTHKCDLKTSRSVDNHSLTAVIEGVDHEGIKAGLKAECRMLVTGDGVITDGQDYVEVKDASEVTIYIVAATNFVNYHDISGNPTEKNLKVLNQVSKRKYIKNLNRHLKAYSEQYNRVSLLLPENTSTTNEDTDKRIEHFAETNDASLVQLLFQYGRYLLITSSQPGGQPANLQGVWNSSLNAPWDSKYTININAEMNYWIADVGNIGETQQPLFDMIRDLSVTGATTAQTMYGCRGWVAHHNTDLWRIAGPVDGSTWGMFPSGGAWLATHLWQHYLFTGDKKFLREWYPVMKGAADFFLDYMQRDPRNGYLVVVPSVSPEHGPMGKRTPVTAGCTMDNQIVFDALSNTLAAAKVLGTMLLISKPCNRLFLSCHPCRWDATDSCRNGCKMLTILTTSTVISLISMVSILRTRFHPTVTPTSSWLPAIHSTNVAIWPQDGVSDGRQISGHECLTATMPTASFPICCTCCLEMNKCVNTPTDVPIPTSSMPIHHSRLTATSVWQRVLLKCSFRAMMGLFICCRHCLIFGRRVMLVDCGHVEVSW